MDYRIEQLRYQLREDPSSRVFYSLAEALRRQGEAGEAANLLRRGLEVHPRYVAAWVALGRTLRVLDDADGAGEAFARALELDRSNLVAARAAGELAADRNDWAGAIEAYRLVEKVLPDDPDITGRIAAAESRMAEEAAEREVLPVTPPAEVVRLADGDPFAVEAGDEVQVGGPDDVFGETIEVAEPIIEESPEPPAVLEPESWTDLDQEVSAGADRESEEPTGVEPIIPATLVAFDRPSGDLEDEPEDESVHPEDVPLPTLTLARLAVQQGDHDLAEATLQSLVEQDPSNSEAVKFLDSLHSRARGDGGDTTSAKVAALRGWLDTIRLASERQRT